MGTPLRLLIVEDCENDAQLVIRELRKGGFDPAFTRVETSRDLNAALDAPCWDAIIADFNLPGFNGLDALRIVQDRGLDIPFLLVSGVIGEEKAVEALKAGAHDFIMKGRYARLAPAMQRELREAAFRRERRQALEELRRAHDELEIRVRERTADLENANAALQAEISERRLAEEALRRSEEELRRAHDKLEIRVRERTEELNISRMELEIQNRELRTTTHELEISRNRYSDLYDSAPLGYTTLDGKGIILEINLTGANLLGEARKNLIGRPFTHFVAKEDVRLFHDHLRRCGQAPEQENVELGIETNGNGPIQAQLNSVPVMDASGLDTHYRTAIIDITEAKRTAQQMVRLERQLMHSQKMESIGILAGGVAHDFNNLLTVISGYGQIIEENAGTDNALLRTSIQQVLEASERARYLTRNLLAFSRKQEIHLRPVVINDVINSVTGFLAGIIGEDIELSTCIPDEKVMVMADSGQIDQVLINLAKNARDAMPAGGRLHIAVRPVTLAKASKKYGLERSGCYSLVSITDTGMGMGKEVKDRIFEPFFTTKEVGKGTGLGLSIIYGIIKQHNGTITVSSVPGKGTAFRIYLPAIDDCMERSGPRKTSPQIGGTETILLAEDEKMVRKFMEKTLGRAGYNIIVALDGEDAVARFRKNPDDISLVVTDVVMPKRNGEELCEDIRSIRPETKVIFISGYAADNMRDKGVTDETPDMVMKPVSRRDLLLKVREVLDRKC